MRIIIMILLLVMQPNCLLAVEKQPFKITISSVKKAYLVGDFPCVIVKVKNDTDKIQYFDMNEIIISPAITYSDHSVSLATVRSPVLATVSGSGVTPHKERIGDHIIGILPGQTLVRIKQVPQIKMPGRATISVAISVSFFSDINDAEGEWGHYRKNSETSIVSSLKN